MTLKIVSSIRNLSESNTLENIAFATTWFPANSELDYNYNQRNWIAGLL